MDFIISLFLCIIYFFIETNASSNRHYFQLYILFFTLRHGDDLLPLFYQPLISEAPDAMTPAPLSASWLKSNLLRPQEIVSPDRNTPLLPKETLDSPFRIPQSASALETVKGHWTEQADPA